MLFQHHLKRMMPVIALFLVFLNTALASGKPMFGGAEHIFIGDEVKVYLPPDESGKTIHHFRFPNGLVATYGDILSLGDFYELEGKPISQGKTDAERKARFVEAFNSFTQKPATEEANKLLAVLHGEQKLMQEAMDRGEDPSHILSEMGNDVARQMNCITGGGCGPTWFLTPGRYLRLAERDYDHFSDNAWLAYKTGHDAAIEVAIEARAKGDLALLERAYAMNAFASHFLSDRFAAGHIRTPRFELARDVTPALTGSLLSSFMHGEENAYGIHVHNLRGDQWIAHGDRSYFKPANRTSRTLQYEALQTSANEILIAYVKGIMIEKVSALIPVPNEIQDGARQDISALFYWDAASKKLMRREDVTNVFDKHWTSKWWGWSTLALLSKHYGLPPDIQARLARSTLRDQAISEGLITDKNIIAALKK